MRRLRSLPISTTFMLLIAGLAVLAIGYGLWSQVLTIRGRINTGNLATAFNRAFTDDDGAVNQAPLDANDTGNCPVQAGGGSSCDPAASGSDPKLRHDKDVGSCRATFSTDGLVGTITKDRAYPGYFCTAWFQVLNSGNVPVRIAKASIQGQEVLPNVVTPFDLTSDGQADVAVHLTGFDVCQQIDPSKVALIDVDQEILQGAPEGSQLSYTVELQFNQWNERCVQTLPVYTVTQAGLTRGQADALASALGISGDILQDDGTARFTADSFLSVPMIALGEERGGEEEAVVTLESFNFDALGELEVIEGKEAIAMVDEALVRARLPFDAWGPVRAQSSAAHSTLEAVDEKGGSLTGGGAPLDTHVNYALNLGGVPLTGPGAKAKVVLDPQGEVAHVVYAMRGLEAGPAVDIVPGSEAREACAADLRAQLGERAQAAQLSVTPSLMYYAPPLSIDTVATIYPFYACNGTLTIGDEQAQLRRTLLPAVASEQPIGPNVQVSADIDGLFVSANAEVSGGTPPYSYQWNSSTSPVVLPDAPQVGYDIKLSDGQAKSGEEVVSVLVVDANGISASDSATLPLGDILIFNVPSGAGFLASPMRVGGVTDVGAEWIGTCQGLGGSAGNAAGFVNRMSSAGVNVRFNWGNQNAWERDFIDVGQRANGLDHSYLDNVDFTFYTGHANGNGWTFCSNQQDGFLHYSENPRWGNNVDLEWLVIAACGPLQLESAGLRWWQRWGPAFEGLHLFMGYQTVTWDNDDEGRLVATHALAGRTIRESWIRTAIEVQGSSEIWAVMGVIGPGGSVNYNDHFWSRGSVGPDIRGDQVHGWWIIWGPS